MNTRPLARRSDVRPPAPIVRWLPAIAACTVLAVVALAGTSGDDNPGQLTSSADAGAADSTVLDPATSSTAAPIVDGAYDITGMTVPPTTVPIATTAVTTPAAMKTSFDHTLTFGEFGDEVKQLQTRLTELGFAPGVADGFFGQQTREAVWAYDKLILGIPREDVDHAASVTNETWQRMQDPYYVLPRRPGSGTHVEIYLPEQVAAVFTDNVATLIIHISSGSALTSEVNSDNSWCETIHIDTDENGQALEEPVDKAVCGVSYTPGGVFRFRWKVQGTRTGPLGGMYNPIYFNYGIAMHGAKNVPLEPASHGCIRMNETISNTFQDYVNLRDIVYVWGQDGKEPEHYSKKQSTPIFNYADPNAATTTTEKATSTTTKSTTETTEPASSSPNTTATPTTVKTTTPATTPPTSPPATAPPATSPPATSPPATSPPATSPPVTAEPTTPITLKP